jgi:5-methyltetrahydropteroyltriglutamate--homocysteine methyltransferase
MPIPVVVGKLKRRASLTADDFLFLRGRTRRTAKATIPAPSANHFFSGDASLKGSPYRDRKAFFADVTAIYREEIADLARLGCTYLQIDEVPIAVMCDPNNQARVRERGEDPQALIDDYIEAINDTVRDRPPGMTICMHLCRGNAGQGQARGGYEPVAERLFQRTSVDGFFLEYDTERAGDFRPLRFLPKGKTAVLGIISTKLRELEPADEVKRRIEEASRYADLDRLCLSPQCGFASGYNVDRLTLADQERKLAHVVNIANEIWA